jgi:hypothetical protein
MVYVADTTLKASVYNITPSAIMASSKRNNIEGINIAGRPGRWGEAGSDGSGLGKACARTGVAKQDYAERV